MPYPGPAPYHAWIVASLDGALVGRDLRITAGDAAALRRYREAGGAVVVATSRNEVSAGRYHRELGLTTPLILYNGARVIDPLGGERLLDLDLGDSWEPIRTHLLPALPDGVGAVGFHGESAHVLRDAPSLAGYARRNGIELLPDRPAGAPAKVTLVAAGPVLGPLARLVTTHCPAARLARSAETYLEILPSGAGKGAALRRLAERARLPLERIAAIGSAPDDTDLLRTAGLGAAAGDGHPQVLAAADLVVAPCGRGAVAELVDHVMGWRH